MSNCLIIDVAHGINVPGKRSPDGKHLEYIWSRDRAKNIMKKILNSNMFKTNFEYYSPFMNDLNEPGMTPRVKKYNEISAGFDNCVVIPLHNDGFGDGSEWTDPRGISFWTSRGETLADVYCNQLFDYFKIHMPNEKFRTAYWLGKDEKVKDPDYEANFTLLAGNKVIVPDYVGIYMEVLFQTNNEDIKKLMSFKWNDMFEDVLIESMINLFDKIDKNILP